VSSAMRYTYYPGCTSETTAVEFGHSTEAVCEALGIELVELEDWNCCGASSAHSLDHELGMALPGRNVALAQEAGLDMVIPCPACYQHCRDANIRMREDEDWRKKMERILDFRYEGAAAPRHLLEVLANDLDKNKLQERVSRPLDRLKVASYYGCVLVRPPELTGWDDPEHPETMDKLEAGADCIVSACGMCEINLDTRQAPRSGKKMPIFYLTELMALAFGLPGVEKWFRKHSVDPRPLLRERRLL